MLEKMFTTRMSADKKKLQTRFSKIRSNSGKQSKIIAIVLFIFVIVSIIGGSVYFAVINAKNDKINSLFELRDTDFYDIKNIEKI